MTKIRLVEHELKWGGDPEDLLVTGSGVEAPDELSALREAVSDERWRPPMRALLDFREVDLSRLKVADVEHRIELLAAMADRIGLCYTAVVVGKDIDFGMVRMQQAMSERRVPYQLEVFRSLEDARRWLHRVGGDASRARSASRE